MRLTLYWEYGADNNRGKSDSKTLGNIQSAASWSILLLSFCWLDNSHILQSGLCKTRPNFLYFMLNLQLAMNDLAVLSSFCLYKVAPHTTALKVAWVLKGSLGICFLMRLKESVETDDAFTDICSSPWQVLTGFPQAYLCGVKCCGICWRAWVMFILPFLVVLVWKLTQYTLLFLCLTSCLVRSARCSVQGLVSKIKATSTQTLSCFWPAGARAGYRHAGHMQFQLVVIHLQSR